MRRISPGGARTTRRAAAAGLGLVLAAALSGCGGGTDTSSAAADPGDAASPVVHHVGARPATWKANRLRDVLARHGGTSHAAKATPDNARVGAIFETDVNGNHFCTASVVHSAGKNLLVTAAHCVHGGKGGHYSTDLVFVPEYRDGNAQQGQWPITSIVVDQRWIDSSDPDLDVAFVVVGQVGGKNIEDTLGGNTLGIDKGFDQVVRITGYPANAGSPISCMNKTTQQSQYQMRIACTGFPGGTSGSPWIAAFDRATGTGTVIGVIGGYQQGGDTDDVSYSVYFDSDVQSLYDRAAATATATASSSSASTAPSGTASTAASPATS